MVLCRIRKFRLIGILISWTILSGALSIAEVLQTQTITVCLAGPPNCDFSSIRKAICAASPGDTIEVQSGLYEENLIIDKDLTLRGLGKEVILSGVAVNSPVILIRDAKVTVEGFTITGGKGPWFPFTGDGIRLEGKASASIRSTIIKGNEGSGILLANEGAVEIWDNRVFANRGWGISKWTRACDFPVATEVTPDVIVGRRNRIYDNSKGRLCGVPEELTHALLTISSNCVPIKVVVNGKLIQVPFLRFLGITLSFPLDTPITLEAPWMLPSCGWLQIIVYFSYWVINGIRDYSPIVRFILDEDVFAYAFYRPW